MPQAPAKHRKASKHSASGGHDAEQKVGRNDPPAFLFETLRTPVLDQLTGAAGLKAKMLSVVAPVGYGKTVLMSLLLADLRRSGKQCHWFALDERDISVDGLISAIKALIDGHSTGLHPTQALFGGNEPLERRIDGLVDRLNRSALPLTIFIDNLHYCSDSGLGRLLDRLCFGTHTTIQFALSGTHEPPFNTPRAVLEGLLRQVGPADLSFGINAVARMLGPQLCEQIGEAGVARVARQTEGWPAATRMVQIILAGSDSPSAALAGFSGSDEGLAPLLNRQVLSGFSSAAREFLLAISPLRSFSVELCRYASGSSKAAAYLDDLLKRNVFIIPQDRNGQWYRLHGLFRDYLVREAERSLPQSRRRQVLQRAAVWCEKQGYWREAVDYALASGFTETVCQILERIAAMFVRDRGDLQQYVRWIEALHEQRIEAGPEAEFWFIWALAFCRRYEDARQHSNRLLQRLKQQGSGDKGLQRRIRLLRISIDSLTDHLFDAHNGAAAWLAERSEDDDPFNVTAAHCIECGFHTSHFRFVEARREIQAARESAFQTGSVYVDGWVSAYAALAPICEGDYASAYPALINTLEAVRRELKESVGAGISGTLALIAARCAVEMGLDHEARQLLKNGLLSSRTHGFLEATALGLEAAVLLWDGKDDELIALPALRDIAAAYAPRLSQMLSCFLIRRLISLGRSTEAQDEAMRLGLESVARLAQGALADSDRIPQMHELFVSVELELMVATGRQQAETRIADEIRLAQKTGRTARSVELLLLSVRLAARSQNTALITRQIAQAVRLAAPRRILRPFLRHADMLAALFSEGRFNELGFVLQEDQQFFADLCARGGWTAASVNRTFARHSEDAASLGKLTPRELELLRLLDAGLGNQQIADHVGVSLTTIKWHLQNLYGKLRVSTRSAALARARSVNLLSLRG